jgi:alanyl-tRNA synthetase
MNTKRLYEVDAYRISFGAEIIASTTVEGRPGVILDRSLFYPTGGGQPHDTGTLDGAPVIDVLEQNDAVVHIMEKNMPAGRVRGKIDWKRRFDHMQQHTGQHILSQAFVRCLNADTVGFHLGETAATIDVTAPRLDWPAIREVEAEADSVVFADMPVRIREATEAERTRIVLRTAPSIKGSLRMVDIADYDSSACCGTHVHSTGEIGLIKVVRFETYKGGVRVTFLCGHRALSAFQAKTEVLEAVTRRMTLGEAQLVDGIDRLLDGRKQDQKTLKAMEKQLLTKEAQERLSRGRRIGAFCLVADTIDGRDAQSVRTLAMQITENPKTVCIFGISSGRATIVVGQSADSPVDLKGMTPDVAELLNGKGGGNSRQIQVSGEDVSRLAPAVKTLTARIEKEIGARSG